MKSGVGFPTTPKLLPPLIPTRHIAKNWIFRIANHKTVLRMSSDQPFPVAKLLARIRQMRNNFEISGYLGILQWFLYASLD